jgi:hypothetical protein
MAQENIFVVIDDFAEAKRLCHPCCFASQPVSQVHPKGVICKDSLDEICVTKWKRNHDFPQLTIAVIAFITLTGK